MNIGPYTFALKSVVIAIIMAMLAFALIFGVRSCDKRRSAAAQAKVERSQAEAASSSAKDASEVQAQINRNEVASDALGRENEKDIRNAEGSNAVVAAGAHNAGLLALCRRTVNRDSERCKLLNAR